MANEKSDLLAACRCVIASHMRTDGVKAAIFLINGLLWCEPAAAGWFWRDNDWDAPDRYPYKYVPPRYYPYYNSNYWRPAWQMRRPRAYYFQPPHYPAWATL